MLLGVHTEYELIIIIIMTNLYFIILLLIIYETQIDACNMCFLLQIGFTPEGKITALDLQLFSNGGAFLDLSLGVRIARVL